MEPQNLQFGGGPTETALHPAVAIAVLVTAVLMLLLPRKRLATPFFLAMFWIPFGEVVVVGGLHFLTPRIIILSVMARMIGSRFSSQGRILPALNAVDKAVIAWALACTLTFILLYAQSAAVINRLGFLIDSLAGYFVVRYLVQDLDDVQRLTKTFAIIAVVLSMCMVAEQVTHRNVFGLVGGERSIPELRNDRIRSQAAFHHPLLAGGFGATMMPLFVTLWRDKKKFAILGLAASLVMTVTSAESTSLLTLLAGVLGLCLWSVRNQMRAIRWVIVCVLVVVHIVMKAPVWALIARIDLTGSSTSYDRFILIDNFIRHFGDWWLIGTKDYGNWGLDMWDLCNQYVAYGQTGGLITLGCFIAIIVLSFRAIRLARRRLRSRDRKHEWFLWCLWAAMFSNMAAYFGLGWGDQTEYSWFALLIFISIAALKPARESAPEAQSLAEPEAIYCA